MRQIEGIPDTIDRKALLGFLASAGFDPATVSALDLRPDGVFVTVKWRDADGHERLDYNRDEVIAHRVYVPLVGGE